MADIPSSDTWYQADNAFTYDLDCPDNINLDDTTFSDFSNEYGQLPNDWLDELDGTGTFGIHTKALVEVGQNGHIHTTPSQTSQQGETSGESLSQTSTVGSPATLSSIATSEPIDANLADLTNSCEENLGTHCNDYNGEKNPIHTAKVLDAMVTNNFAQDITMLDGSTYVRGDFHMTNTNSGHFHAMRGGHTNTQFSPNNEMGMILNASGIAMPSCLQGESQQQFQERFQLWSQDILPQPQVQQQQQPSDIGFQQRHRHPQRMQPQRLQQQQIATPPFLHNFTGERQYLNVHCEPTNGSMGPRSTPLPPILGHDGVQDSPQGSKSQLNINGSFGPQLPAQKVRNPASPFANSRRQVTNNPPPPLPISQAMKLRKLDTLNESLQSTTPERSSSIGGTNGNTISVPRHTQILKESRNQPSQLIQPPMPSLAPGRVSSKKSHTGENQNHIPQEVRISGYPNASNFWVDNETPSLCVTNDSGKYGKPSRIQHRERQKNKAKKARNSVHYRLRDGEDRKDGLEDFTSFVADSAPYHDGNHPPQFAFTSYPPANKIWPNLRDTLERPVIGPRGTQLLDIDFLPLRISCDVEDYLIAYWKIRGVTMAEIMSRQLRDEECSTNTYVPSTDSETLTEKENAEKIKGQKAGKTQKERVEKIKKEKAGKTQKERVEKIKKEKAERIQGENRQVSNKISMRAQRFRMSGGRVLYSPPTSGQSKRIANLKEAMQQKNAANRALVSAKKAMERLHPFQILHNVCWPMLRVDPELSNGDPRKKKPLEQSFTMAQIREEDWISDCYKVPKPCGIDKKVFKALVELGWKVPTTKDFDELERAYFRQAEEVTRDAQGHEVKHKVTREFNPYLMGCPGWVGVNPEDQPPENEVVNRKPQAPRIELVFRAHKPLTTEEWKLRDLKKQEEKAVKNEKKRKITVEDK